MSSIKSIKYFLLTTLMGLIGTTAYGLPFFIEPNGPLPQSLIKGGTVTASYLVTNNTGKTRVANYVKWLPPFVVQDVSDPTACQTTFTLGPHYSATDHCILNLRISGPVNAFDPIPHHHLFVCFAGGITCAGTFFPLNVSVIKV